MSRSEEFKKSVLYHGTHQVFSVGDVVKPGNEVGVYNWQPNDTQAYATDDLGAAMYFANESANNASEKAQRRINGRVYHVSPINENDTSTKPMRDVKMYSASGETPNEISSPTGFKVTGEVPQEELPSLGNLMQQNIMRKLNKLQGNK